MLAHNAKEAKSGPEGANKMDDAIYYGNYCYIHLSVFLFKKDL